MNYRKIFGRGAVCAVLLVVTACGAAGLGAGASEAEESQVARVKQSAGFRVEMVAEGLQVPWSLVWTAPERLLVAERAGRVRVVKENRLQAAPLYVVPDVEPSGESGLMGMMLHPRYAENKFIYLAYAYRADGRRVKIVRLRDAGETLTDARTVLDNIPAQKYHAGTRLRFGTDNKLYVTTGDSTEGKLAQRLDSLAGKTLRLNDDGSIPADNPFVNRANARGEIWSYGHRNSQGLDFHPTENFMVQTEHGPSFPLDGWRSGGDEINIVEAGKNYGWNVVSFDKSREGMESPVVMYKSAIAPASGMFYRGTGAANRLPGFVNNYFFGALKGESIVRLVFDGRRVVNEERLCANEYGRIREIAEAPDGAIYFTTSNRDGRGKPASTDDRIMRIVPSKS